MKPLYRKMTEIDIPQVSEIEENLFPDPWSYESFVQEISNIDYSYPFILEFDNEIIGYSVCWYYLNELHIGNIAIKVGYQGQGLGSYLIKKIFEYFPDYEKAYLEVGISNLRAIGLYLKFGFKELSKRKSYYPDGEDAIIMIKYAFE